MSSEVDSPLPPRDYDFVCYGMLEEINSQTLRSAKRYNFRQLSRYGRDDRYAKLSLVSNRLLLTLKYLGGLCGFCAMLSG